MIKASALSTLGTSRVVSHIEHSGDSRGLPIALNKFQMTRLTAAGFVETRLVGDVINERVSCA